MTSAPASSSHQPIPLPTVPTGSQPAACGWLPWRCATLGWVVTGLVLVVWLPLFLRMPIWIDITLYDLAARAVLNGGVHYRDVFDTNPPGFVWVLCLVRTVLGPSMEAIRAVDFAVVATVVALLLRWARAGGATRANVAWTAAGVAVFYLNISEFNHCQRDVWIMLPALAAAWYRVRRVQAAHARPVTDGWVFRTAFLEGLIWGVATWIKPHVIVLAAVTWLVVQPRLAGSADGRWSRKLLRSLADFGGAFCGGLLVGGLGLGWLVWSGTWPYMYDVFANWNPDYLQSVFLTYPNKKAMQFGYFPPWSLLGAVAGPLALLNLIDARPWAGRDTVAIGPVGRALSLLYDRRPDAAGRYARGILAVVYLTWVAATFALQKDFHYAHVPEIILMLAVFAANRWALVAAVAAYQIGVMVWLAADPSAAKPWWKDRSVEFRRFVWEYPDRDPNRFQWWKSCFAREVSPQVRDGVAFETDFFSGVCWSDIADVEAFLRGQHVTDYQVLCWNDSPHVLYLTMNLRPPIRFMHLSTATEMGDEPKRRVRKELEDAKPNIRFVVSDLRRVTRFYSLADRFRFAEPGPGPDLLPPIITPESRAAFPMNQPTVFRSGNGHGRYVVHVLVQENPIGEIKVPSGIGVP